MSTDTVTDVATITRIGRGTDGREIARDAYTQLLGLLGRLQPDDWDARTDCPDWHVADMVRHLVGAARGYGSLREMARQQLWAARHKGDYDGNALDACNDLQVQDHAHLSPGELVATLRRLVPGAVAGRFRRLGPLRTVALPVDTTGSVAAGMPADLTLGHLLETVLTRDVWLHAIDIERATGVPADRIGGPDARVVEDVVAEWAGRHGQPFELTLTGPGGGRWRQGSGGDHLEHDAREFCRILSGRAAATHPLHERRVWF